MFSLSILQIRSQPKETVIYLSNKQLFNQNNNNNTNFLFSIERVMIIIRLSTKRDSTFFQSVNSQISKQAHKLKIVQRRVEIL